MKMKVKEIYLLLKRNYSTRVLITSLISLVVVLLFAAYNGALGIINNSIWNGSICIYYLLLLIIRGIILNFKIRNKDNNTEKPIFIVTSLLVLVLNLVLIIPISLMVMNRREVLNNEIIPAIIMAAYTTYKITIATINYQKTRKCNELLIKELRTINFIDAFVSLLTLQNTLILLNGEMSNEMMILSAISSGVVVFFMIVISIFLLIKGIRDNKVIVKWINGFNWQEKRMNLNNII